jgi:hypothetical protein
MDTITIKDYLDKKGIEYRKTGSELITKCLFGECDEGRQPKDYRLYFSSETGQYHCKRCGAEGNIFTLAKHLGDEIKDVANETSTTSTQKPSPEKKTKTIVLSPEYVETYHRALPERIRTYLNGRGISNSIIDQQKLGWGNFYGRDWIVIPVTDIEGKYSILRLRQDPEDTANKTKMMVYPSKGTQLEIYGWEMLRGYTPLVVMCEGEFDRLVLLSNGIPAVTSTGGAGGFKEGWAQHFTKSEQIYVCYDRDEAGKNGSEKALQKILETEHENVFCIDLPEMGDGNKDITDFFVSFKGNVDSFMALARRVTKAEVNDRIKPIEHPYKQTTFAEWHEVISTNFPELAFPAEICLSIISQILILEITNPFALVLIGVPSGGKTICINFFDSIEELTYASDKFTPASFVTNASNVARNDLADLDLLPRIKDKAFLVRDLATLFSKRFDDLNELLGILTRVLDGEGLSTDTGTHGRRNLSGAYLFMMIAASTPLQNRVYEMMGSLGSRLFFYQMHSREKEANELVAQLKTSAFKEKERACRKITRNLLYTLWDSHKEGIVWNRDADSDDVIRVIAHCAKLLAKLRGVISNCYEKKSTNEEVDYDFSPPIIENPDRISMLLYNLSRGHAVATGRKQISPEDLKIVIELSIDSAPTVRSGLFRALLKNSGVMTTTQVEQHLDRTKPIAIREMRILEELGVCKITASNNEGRVGNSEKQIKLEKDFEWFLSDEFRHIRGIETEPDTQSNILN